MKLTAKDLDTLMHVEFRNRDLLQGKKISGVSTDSRKISEGELFIALKGANYDGHTFVADVFARGAAVGVVDTSFKPDSVSTRPLLVVEDTTRALGELAHQHRMKFDIPILAIGGSNGKTTTKDMVTAVLATTYKILGTEGNLNNHIGVPQMLLHLRKRHEIAVIEIGTNHPGEIDYLCSILVPTHGLVTNVGREHLEFFKSIEGVADEEGVLFDHLKRNKKSVAFVNTDDALIQPKAKGLKRRITYGLASIPTKSGVDVRGMLVGVNETGCASFEYVSKKPARHDTIQLAIPGEHNVMNALAAVAVGLSFKVPAKRIRRALESLHPTSKRMEVLNYEGVIIYNDTYNANPDSMISALKTLAAAKVPGKKIAVLGDMRELGEHGREEHARVGREAAKL
ncbi:MAG: UDP-N-acetylmuramoyl-tripeptide--D-alanyl-D-alanine ligase, partial [Bacteroidota bacterium]